MGSRYHGKINRISVELLGVKLSQGQWLARNVSPAAFVASAGVCVLSCFCKKGRMECGAKWGEWNG